MDARGVTREIRRVVWPELREEGFTAFTGRTAWRYAADAVDVVNFQSFGASIADAVGCTTFSFSVNLGVWRPEDAADVREPKRDARGRLRPAEYECGRRHRLHKALEQPWFRPFSSETRRWPFAFRRHREALRKVMRTGTHDRPDTWFVLPDGSNLDECVADALRALRDDGLRWLEEARRG